VPRVPRGKDHKKPKEGQYWNTRKAKLGHSVLERAVALDHLTTQRGQKKDMGGKKESGVEFGPVTEVL